MPRRRNPDFWLESLPPEIEWALVIATVLVWGFVTLGYYLAFLSRIQRLMDAFAPLGVTPSETAFLPILEMVFHYAPFLAIPIAYRVWRWARQTLLRSFSRAY